MYTYNRLPGVNTKGVFTLVLLLISAIYVTPELLAQGGQFGRVEEIDTNINKFHYLVRPGSATIEVSAFGNMVSPGIYVLEEGSNLAFLLALTGGPSSFNQPDVRYITTIRLFRNSGGGQALIYEAPFEEIMDQISNAPILSEGDVVTVEVIQKRKLNWRDVFTIIGPVLSTLLLIDQLANR